MNKITEDTIRRYNLIEKGETVVCGLSGGADSVAMILVLSELSHTMGFNVCAAHLNHMIRGQEADEDENFVRELCLRHNIPLYAKQISAVQYSEEHGYGLEEGARLLRYSFFDDAAEFFSADKIATAHNADDNLETIIFNLQRGSGITGLCGIPMKRDKIIRPIIFSDRNAILKYLSEKGQNYRTDSTNSCTDYTRNRIRLNIIPEIKKINPTASTVVARNTELLRNDCEFFDLEVKRIIRENCKIFDDKIQIQCSVLKELHKSLSTRIVRAMIDRLVGVKDYGNKHIFAAVMLAQSESAAGTVSLPQKMQAVKYNGLFEIRHEQKQSSTKINSRKLNIDGETPLPEIGLIVQCSKLKTNCKFMQTTDTFCVNCDRISGELIVRSREQGDKITLGKRNVTKTLKKLMTEMKIPTNKREQIPVISDSNGVVAVYGIGCDKNKQAENNSAANCLYITIRSVKNDD